MSAPVHRLLLPLRSRPFRWLLAGQLVSIFGDRLSYLAMVALLAARTDHFEGAGAAGTLSGLALALLLPSTFLSPWVAGRLDRWRRRDVLVAADTARAVVGLAMAAALPALSVGGALAFVAAGAVANVFFLPARVAVVPELVAGEADYNPANALGLLAAVLATVLGTLVGGVLLARIGVRGALALDAVSFAVSVVTLLQLPRTPAPAPLEGTSIPARGDKSHWPGAPGFGALLAAPRPRAALVLLLATWVIGALLHVCGTLRLQALTPRVTDLLAPALAALGAGGAIGAVMAGTRLSAGRSRAAAAALAVCAGALAVLARASSPGWILAAAFAAGIASAPLYILSDTEIQETVEGGRRGAALAARDFVCKTGFLAVALALGAFATPGTSGAFLVAASALTVALGAGYALRRPLRT